MIGTRLGPYEITTKLGEGGMGVVFRAKDSQLGREVALKVLPEGLTDDPERLARFEREAKLLAQLNHPNIAQIHGLEVQGDTRALVMELVEGPTLAERLELGSPPLEESLSIARQIAEALEEAHEKGIIHRDLKPQNVKASIEGKVKVLDFGLAKAMDPAGTASGAASASQLAASPTLTLGATVQGVILGTAAYMSPEQAKGLAVDKRADIWAFGVVLYEMLTGQRLFGGDTVPEVLAGVIKNEIDVGALPAEVPPAIRQLVRRCLERNPRNRLHHIADARIVIDDVIAGKTDSPAAESVPPSASASRTVQIAALGAIVVAAAAGFLAGRGGIAPVTGTDSSPAPLEVRKLTFRPGREANPALSQDGRSLFFTANREGSDDLDIFFVPVGGKRPIDLTADSPADDWYPAVSPDGTTVAFRSERAGGGIYLMGTTGESPRRLVDGCYDPAWSPDGTRIVCTTFPARDPFNRGGKGDLRIVDVATGASSDLVTGDAAAPAWSPDGRWVAYWGLQSDESGQRDLWSIAAGGGEPIPLTDDPSYDWNPVWSEDGAKLYFLTNRGGGPNLWRLPIDRESGRASGAPESVALPTEFAESAARGGGRWVFSSRSMRATVETMRLDPERIAPIGEPRRVFATTTQLQSLALSPDSATIAYTTVFPRQDLFVSRLDGGSPVQLTDDPANDRFAAWDPDGSRILFMSNRNGRYEQWAIRPDGSGLEQLTRSSAESQWSPALSPDRRLLSAVSERGTQLYDASGPPPWTSAERIPNPEPEKERVFSGFSWSPDGERLAGQLLDRAGTEPPRIAVWDGREKKVRLFDQEGRVAAWYPDGRHLLIRHQEIFAKLDLAKGETSEVPADPRFADASFSPDLRQVVTFENEAESDLWLAEGIE